MKSLRKIIRESIEKMLLEKYQIEIREDGDIFLGEEKIGEITAFNRRNKYLTIEKIFIAKDYRGKGYGEEAMRQMIDFANKENLIIALTPDDVWGSSKSKLINWYKKMGFVMNKGKNKDFEHMHLMHKLPDAMEENSWPQSNMRNFVPPQYPIFPQPEDYDEFGNKLDDISR